MHASPSRIQAVFDSHSPRGVMHSHSFAGTLRFAAQRSQKQRVLPLRNWIRTFEPFTNHISSSLRPLTVWCRARISRHSLISTVTALDNQLVSIDLKPYNLQPM